MAKIAHHRITRRVAEEIQSFAKKEQARRKILLSMYIQPETEKWLKMLAQKLRVTKTGIILYFIEEELCLPIRFDTKKYNALLRIRAQNPNSSKLTPLYLPTETYAAIGARAETLHLEKGTLINTILMRSIKE